MAWTYAASGLNDRQGASSVRTSTPIGDMRYRLAMCIPPRRTLGVLVAGICGLVLGLNGCDNDPPPATTCTDWLTCYVGCRDGQYARGDDQALTQDELHQLCVSECLDIVAEVEQWPTDLDLTLRNPEDVGFFWGRMAFCLNGGA